MRIAIVGAPNVGKSTILNHLAGRRAAIVSANPGTTRDAIEVILDISGYKVLPLLQKALLLASHITAVHAQLEVL